VGPLLRVVATVAVCEELIYRGFLQALLEKFSGSAIVAVLGSAALFAVAHLYQGRRGMVATSVVGVIFSVFRAWTGSLMPSLISHFVADLAVGFIAPGRLRRALAEIH